MSRLNTFILLICLFCEGFVLMGFEMLGGRYLNPYFGSGIDVWACIISVFLLSMTIGYFVGGTLADKFASIFPIAIVTAFAGVALLLVSFYANDIILLSSDMFGDRFAGTLITSILLFFIPTTLLSFWSPFMVRILIQDVKSSGKITGFVYATSTFGNVCGILVTAYILVPTFGVRLITVIFGFILFGLSALLVLMTLANRRRAVALAVAVALIPQTVMIKDAKAAQPTAQILVKGNYPEGALFMDDALLFTEMTSDRITRISAGESSTFWEREGCGPTSIANFRKENLVVLCHLSRQLVMLDRQGNTLKIIGPDWGGFKLTNPNDGNSDGHGGLFFSDPGSFGLPSQKTGKLYHLSNDLKLTQLANGLHYPNGVAYHAENRNLYVSEHLARRILALKLATKIRSASTECEVCGESAEFSFSGQGKILLDLQPHMQGWQLSSNLAGPDGIRIAKNGAIVFAIYGAGKIGVVKLPGNPLFLDVPFAFPTSVAVKPGKVVSVGAYSNSQYPYKGAVAVFNFPKQ